MNYAESPRAGDWTLRSTLVRLAQPEPLLVADVLESVRSLDFALHPIRRHLAASTVCCDRGLDLDCVEIVDGMWSLTDPKDPYPDTRTADLARLTADAGDLADEIVDTYSEVIELSPEDRNAVVLLRIATKLDLLAETLVTWAPTAPKTPPVETIRAVNVRVRSMLNEIAASVERV